VRVRAALGGGEEEDAAAALTGLRLHRVDERTAEACAADRLVDDERRELSGRRGVLQRGGHVQRGEPGHRAVHLRDDDAVACGAHPVDPRGHRPGGRRIPQLPEEIRDRRGILLPCIPDGQLQRK